MRIITVLLLVIAIQQVVFAQMPVPFKDSTGHWGYKSENGTIAIPPQYDDAHQFDGAGYAAVNKGRKEKVSGNTTTITASGKWGVLDRYYTLCVPFLYDGILTRGSDGAAVNTGGVTNVDGYIEGGKWGVYDFKTQKLILPQVYDFVGYFTTLGNMFCVYQGGKYLAKENAGMPAKNATGRWGIISSAGDTLAPFRFQAINYISSNILLMQQWGSQKLGLFNTAMKKMVAPCVYDSIFAFDYSTESALAFTNGKYGWLNKQGTPIVPFVYEQVLDRDFSKGFVRVKQAGEFFDIDMAGNKLVAQFEPYETQFQKAFELANNSRERCAALNTYEEALQQMKLSQGQITYVLAKKFQQMVEIDFYSVCESLLRFKKQNNNLTTYLNALKALSPDQGKAAKQVFNYIVDDFIAQQNNKERPPYPYNAPKPGYGWGKLKSSDKVAPPPTAYVASVTPAVPDIDAKKLVGKLYSVSTQFDGIKVYKVLNVEGYAKDKLYCAVKTINCKINCGTTYETIMAADVVYGNSWVRYKEFDNRMACDCCGGVGNTTSTFKHTNDYQYTYGVKVTYSSSYTQTCKCCGGIGFDKYKKRINF